MAEEKTEDIINCRNCGKITAVVNEHFCQNCGAMVCLVCGCTDENGCLAGCFWIRPGLCSVCTELPNPGGIEAIAGGCLCPIIDNHYGKGRETEANGGVPLFWISDACPMHSSPENYDEF